VYVQKLDNGKLLIMPKLRKKWPSGFLESFGNMPRTLRRRRVRRRAHWTMTATRLFDDEVSLALLDTDAVVDILRRRHRVAERVAESHRRISA
jgi:hypothetical protein